MSMVGAAKLLVLTYHHIFHHGLMQIVLDMCCCYKTLILQKTFGSNKMQVEGSSVRALVCSQEQVLRAFLFLSKIQSSLKSPEIRLPLESQRFAWVLERGLQAYSKIKSQNQVLKRRVVKQVSKNMGRRRKVPQGSATPKVPKTSVSQPQGLERQTNQDMFRDKIALRFSSV